jgi:hypothetical protein
LQTITSPASLSALPITVPTPVVELRKEADKFKAKSMDSIERARSHTSSNAKQQQQQQVQQQPPPAPTAVTLEDIENAIGVTLSVKKNSSFPVLDKESSRKIRSSTTGSNNNNNNNYSPPSHPRIREVPVSHSTEVAQKASEVEDLSTQVLQLCQEHPFPRDRFVSVLTKMSKFLSFFFLKLIVVGLVLSVKDIALNVEEDTSKHLVHVAKEIAQIGTQMKTTNPQTPEFSKVQSDLREEIALLKTTLMMISLRMTFHS